MSKVERFAFRKSAQVVSWVGRWCGICSLAAGSLLMVACDSLVGIVPESKLPEVASKLVVHSFISPQDTALYVAVSESVPVFGEIQTQDGSGRIVDSAIVRMEDGTKSYELKFDSKSNLYIASTRDFPILPGRTYTLMVSEGGRAVKATTTVPDRSVVITSYTMDTVYARKNIFDSYVDTLLTMRCSWEDISGQKNYYRVRSQISISEVSDYAGQGGQIFQRTSTTIRQWGSSFVTDNNADGKQITSSEAKYSIAGFGWSPHASALRTNKWIDYVDIELFNVTKEYFDHHRSIESGQSTDDNPFAEPSITFSNVEGGLGVFAASNRFVLRVRFDPKK